MANFTQTDPGALTDPSAGQSVIRRMVLGALASQGALPGSTRPGDLVAGAVAPESNSTKVIFSPSGPTTEPGAVDNPSSADVMHQILAGAVGPSRGLDTFQRPVVTPGSLATLSTQRPWSETLPGAVMHSSDSASPSPSEQADLWGTRSYGGSPRVTRPPKISAGALISPEMFKTPTEHAPTNTRPGELTDSTPLTPEQLRQSGRPALAQYEQDASAPTPQLEHPKQLGKFANTVGTIGEVALDAANLPQASEIVGEHATNAGREALAQAEYQQQVGNRNDQLATDAQRANAENAATPKPIDYQVKTIGGHLWSINPQTGETVKDLGPVNANSPKVRSVTADSNGNAIAVFDNGTTKPLGYKVTTKQQILSNPFEAYLYGTPAQKQSAQDFITLERSTGAQYHSPSELSEKYQLFKHDPKAYEAMFGTRQSGITQATATKMLDYFDRRRREIESDYTLSDQQKQQKLTEVQSLEQPFMDAARADQSANAGAVPTPGAETITVVNPQGVTGTIPLGNLKKALTRGYKVAPQQ